MMICSTLCYVQKNGKTVMLERKRGRGEVHVGKWNGLGGKMEEGETPEECVAREVREESGLKIKSPRLRGVLTFPNFDGNDWLVFVYVAKKFSGRLLKESREGRLHWIPTPRVAGLPLWEGDKHFLPWLKGKKFFSGKFVYKKGQFKKYEAVFY